MVIVTTILALYAIGVSLALWLVTKEFRRDFEEEYKPGKND